MPDRPNRTLAVVCAAIVLVPISATGASLALPGVARSLHTGLSAAQWVVNAFFLTFASCMAVTGSLADLTGRRRMFACGLAVFSVAMLVAAAAPDFGVLIAARAVAGAGAAATTTGGSALLAQSFPGQRRTRAFALFGTSIGLGLAFGPLIAGVLTSVGGWRLFFLVAAVVMVPILGASRLVGESRDRTGASVDRLGAVTFTGGLSLFVVAVVEGPSLGWDSPAVAGAFAAAAVLLVAFRRVERRSAHPLVDVTLLANPRFAAVCAMPVLLAFGFVALLIVLPPYLAAVDGYSALRAGLLLMLLTGPTLVVPLVVARLVGRVSRRALLVTTMLVVAAGVGWLTVLRPGDAVLVLAGPLVTIGVGFGISLTVLDGAAVSAVEPARAGMAAGVFNTARLAGEAVAISVLGSILTAVTQAHLGAGAAGRAATARLLQGDLDGAARALGGSRAAAAGAYTAAMHTACWVLTGLMLLGAALVAALARGPDPAPDLAYEQDERVAA